MYLQTLCNRWGDFGVSWNFEQEDGETGFTKKRSVMELWQEDYDHPAQCRLQKVMHREAMPIEHFIEIDDTGIQAYNKMLRTKRLCVTYGLEYCIYKSRKGYHISVLDPDKIFSKKHIIEILDTDKGMISKKCTWSMEWTNHWKEKTFVIKAIECTSGYKKLFLGL